MGLWSLKEGLVSLSSHPPGPGESGPLPEPVGTGLPDPWRAGGDPHRITDLEKRRLRRLDVAAKEREGTQSRLSAIKRVRGLQFSVTPEGTRATGVGCSQ